ncbi:beta-ketoacyl-[acyl-carrier-protein] synthase family protein [Motilimonas pumila]|uniref:Beta-ketoacyl-[acyl-carrier-protein] synthase family protein n=1 Tax=Motilimonas pumila TaxID=2303987 RepID=A0A418YIH9_9GAMM|nr:beta-ketoacyl-[acyl-carrier-protein] synthase family protein [Motilimonas pumila]RJG50440.1 beta-ketoacyl-[acyl-carrier-protein] synthase family protein [Motilimonas pumila]
MIAVTGLGICSALGNDTETVWSRMLAGQTGIQTLPPSHSLAGHGVHLLAQCTRPSLQADFGEQVPALKKQLRHMHRISQMLCYAAFTALQDAHLAHMKLANNPRVALLVGASSHLCEDVTAQALTERNPNWFLQTYANIHLAHLAILTGISGPSSCIVNACTSGSQAIGLGYKMLQHNEADTVIVAGCDSRISPAFLSGFSRLNMHSPGHTLAQGIQPFAEHRNGFVLGEGAGVMVLERESHAHQRQAKVHAKIVGYGNTTDAHRLTDPSAHGKQSAMSMALTDAQLTATDIQYVNAHGTGTKLNDRTECQAIAQLLPHRPKVNSSKSLLGHTLAASGVLESIVCVQSLKQQRLHPNLNLQPAAQDCPVNLVGNIAETHAMEYCLNNSSAIGGSNTSLIFQRAATTACEP